MHAIAIQSVSFMFVVFVGDSDKLRIHSFGIDWIGWA